MSSGALNSTPTNQCYACTGTSFGPVSVSVSVTSRSSVETAEGIGLVFGMGFPSTYPTLYYSEIRVSAKIRLLSSGTLLQTLSSWHIDRRLSSRKVDAQSVVNWTIVGQLS